MLVAPRSCETKPVGRGTRVVRYESAGGCVVAVNVGIKRGIPESTLIAVVFEEKRKRKVEVGNGVVVSPIELSEAMNFHEADSRQTLLLRNWRESLRRCRRSAFVPASVGQHM